MHHLKIAVADFVFVDFQQGENEHSLELGFGFSFRTSFDEEGFSFR